MKISKTIIRLFFLSPLLFIFSTCKKEKPDYSTCRNCAIDTLVSTITELDAKVITFAHDPVINNKPSITLGFTIAKSEATANGDTFVFSDSLLVPCPAIPKKYQIPGTKVKITGNLKSCDRLLSCYNCTYFFGRKFELTNIH